MCATAKDKINATVNEVREASYKEKTNSFNLDSEKDINSFLDKIIDFKQLLTKKTTELNSIVDDLESLTWFDEVDQDCLKLINDIIAATRDWRISLVKQYVWMNGLRSKKIALEEIKEFKHAIDDLKETADDLESVFFHLPQNQEFQEITRELQLA